MKRRPIYLAPDVLRWRPSLPGGVILPDTDKRRAYDLLRRSEFFLAQPQVSEADLADCLGNLRRAMTHRAQVLERVYHLRVPLQSGAKRHFLELLAQVGIVRPLFLRALLEARNAVEYRDRKPPSKKRCYEMAESVWYFLRSTDPLVLCRRDNFSLNPCEDGYPSQVYYLEVNITYGSRFKMEARGWIPAKMVSLTPTSEWIRVDAADVGTKLKRWPDRSDHADKSDDDWWVRGYLAPEVQSLRSLLMLGFEAE